jgi:hypothetical protein
MYMLLPLYCVFNLDDVSWGTRETIQEQVAYLSYFLLLYSTLIKKNIKYSSNIRKFRLEHAIAKSYMTNGLLIYGEIFAHFLICIRKPFLTYVFATAPL